MRSFLPSLLLNPASVVTFSLPLALSEADCLFASHLGETTGKKWNAETSLVTLIEGAKGRQLKNPQRYRINYNAAKSRWDNELTRLRTDDFAPEKTSSPFDTCIRAVRQLEKISKELISPLEENSRLQKILVAVFEARRKLEQEEWSQLYTLAETPLQKLLVRFLKESDAISPLHLASFLRNTKECPANPTVSINVGEMRLPGWGNWVLAEPGDFVVAPGIVTRFLGEEMAIGALRRDLLQVNGIILGAMKFHSPKGGDQISLDGRAISLGIRQVRYEIPLTVWHHYPVDRNEDHPYHFSKFSFERGEKAKYVVVKTKEGDYSWRLGSDHHYQMVNPGDIFIAGGWFMLGENRQALIDGNTVRFGHIMKDNFALARLMIATTVLRESGFTASFAWRT